LAANRRRAIAFLELASNWVKSLFDLAAQVTSRGYAGLTYFSTKYGDTAHTCFFPDPVCARLLAMGMMIRGIRNCKRVPNSWPFAPTFWMKTAATEMFIDSLCRPAKGDMGEIACALYLLFCGDRIRYAIDKELRQFSVPLDKWISLLLNPNQEVIDVAVVDQKPIASVSCVQVCRNYLRHSLQQMLPLLPHWYRSGRAIYTYSNCRGFDLIVPLCYRRPGAELNKDDEGQYDYCPLFVSVKNCLSLSPKEESDLRMAMVARLKSEGIQTGLCMLFLEGLRKVRGKTPQFNKDDIFRFSGDGICSFTVVVDSDDPFGISNFLETVSTYWRWRTFGDLCFSFRSVLYT